MPFSGCEDTIREGPARNGEEDRRRGTVAVPVTVDDVVVFGDIRAAFAALGYLHHADEMGTRGFDDRNQP